MGVRTVDRLLKKESGVGLALRNRGSSRVNGIGKLLVEKAGLQNAERLEEVLDEEVVIVGLGRLEIGIAFLNETGSGGGIRIDNGGRDQVSNVWPRNALAVVCADIGVFLDQVLCLYARQCIEIARALENFCRVARILSKELIRREAGVRCVKANAGLQPQFAEGNDVLQIACVDAFIGVKEGAVGTAVAGELIQSELAGRDALLNRLLNEIVVGG